MIDEQNEEIDILDENGNETGKKEKRENVHKKGLWHKTLHLFLYRYKNKKLELLFQLRSKNKIIFPSKLGVAMGGHISSKEKIETAFKREVKEELGIDLNINDCKFLDIYKIDVSDKDKLDREFCHTYIYEYNDDLNKFCPSKYELDGLYWCKLEDLKKIYRQNNETFKAQGLKLVNNEFIEDVSIFSIDDFVGGGFPHFIKIGQEINEVRSTKSEGR